MKIKILGTTYEKDKKTEVIVKENHDKRLYKGESPALMPLKNLSNRIRKREGSLH